MPAGNGPITPVARNDFDASAYARIASRYASMNRSNSAFAPEARFGLDERFGFFARERGSRSTNEEIDGTRDVPR